MPGVGLEPTRAFAHSILSRGCLPISAPGRLTASAGASARQGGQRGIRTLAWRFCRPSRYLFAIWPYFLFLATALKVLQF